MSAPRETGLPQALKDLVYVVESALGRAVREAGGERLYREVEAVRRLMKRCRDGGPAARRRSLDAARVRLSRLSAREREGLARAYTLYLELANACENAYRAHRLRRAGLPACPRADLVYVLTAHPTESRSPANVALLRRLQAHLLECLELGRAPRQTVLRHLIHLLWRAGTHPSSKPSVEDEAAHIVSMLDDSALLELLALHREGGRVRLRTWVGGDKDGHPGVGPAQTLASLRASRERLLDFASGQLDELEPDARLLRGVDSRALRRRLEALRRLRPGDGRRVRALSRELAALSWRYERAAGAPHSALSRLRRLLELFPSLALPLELREEAGAFAAGSPIARMIEAVRRVARGGAVDWYARGLVVSMARSAADLRQAARLAGSLPVIPLFETPEALRDARAILEAARLPARRGRLEIMLGYSDTAKRMGAFPSRLAIGDAMEDLQRWARRRRLRVVFFHGSGGSEGRGGGTIEEQAAGWPPEALRTLKMTIQGEMIDRTFSTPEILRSQVCKAAAVQSAPPRRRRPSPFSRELSELAERAYRELLSERGLVDLLARATPYPRLGELNIGSRPSKRAGAPSLDSLRAIPWVLCWTQTRLLLPVWYGLGSAWRELRRRPGAVRALRRAVSSDPLLRGFLRQLAFSFSKSEPLIWERYLALLPSKSPLASRIEREYRDALSLARAASPAGLLSDRRWLEESISYRAPMIHPLNLLQIEALRGPWNPRLFRETVTGVAAGMLTTG